MASESGSQEVGFRPLSTEEITQLTGQGCSCADWSNVQVAEGFDPALPLQTQGGFDPSSRSEFGSVALRLTF